jgi:hypothetical protein
MCWNERVSLNTYIVALFGTVFAIMNGFPINVVVWLHVFSLIQLVEHLIWTNLNDPDWNHVFSLAGLVVLVLEPIASIFFMNAGPLRDTFLASYALSILTVLYLYYPWRPHTELAADNHLRWIWWPPTNINYILFSIWVFFFIVPIFIAKYYVIGIVAIVTMIISIITYHVEDTFSSMWCWIANGVWLIVIGFIAADKCFEDMLCKK